MKRTPSAACSSCASEIEQINRDIEAAEQSYDLKRPRS